MKRQTWILSRNLVNLRRKLYGVNRVPVTLLTSTWNKILLYDIANILLNPFSLQIYFGIFDEMDQLHSLQSLVQRNESLKD